MKEMITSTANPKIKDMVRLQQRSSERRAQGLIVIEGWREIGLALKAGATIQQLFVCPEVFLRSHREEDLALFSAPLIEVSSPVFEKIAYREGSDGIIALATPKQWHLQEFSCNQPSLFVVLEAVEKPGNLGAVLRSADASGASAVFVCDPLTDIYNPNVIRASIGCVFTVPVIACSSEDALQWFRANNVSLFAAALQDADEAFSFNFKNSTAFILGTEANGLGPFWREHADHIIKLPMLGKIDSLNVSAAASILLYEAVRQRNLK
jgi:TrmH family RNA methyltransferase